MADGQYHIQSIVDVNRASQVIAKNEFMYDEFMAMSIPCSEGESCPPPPPAVVSLSEINRTDRDGKVLSEIKDFQPANLRVMEPRPYQATIALPDGREDVVIFDTTEELLAKAMTFEKTQPPVVDPVIVQGIQETFGFSGDQLGKEGGTAFLFQNALKRAAEKKRVRPATGLSKIWWMRNETSGKLKNGASGTSNLLQTRM